LWRPHSSGDMASASGAAWRARCGASVGRQYCAPGARTHSGAGTPRRLVRGALGPPCGPCLALQQRACACSGHQSLQAAILCECMTSHPLAALPHGQTMPCPAVQRAPVQAQRRSGPGWTRPGGSWCPCAGQRPRPGRSAAHAGSLLLAQGQPRGGIAHTISAGGSTSVCMVAPDSPCPGRHPARHGRCKRCTGTLLDARQAGPSQCA